MNDGLAGPATGVDGVCVFDTRHPQVLRTVPLPALLCAGWGSEQSPLWAQRLGRLFPLLRTRRLPPGTQHLGL